MDNKDNKDFDGKNYYDSQEFKKAHKYGQIDYTDSKMAQCAVTADMLEKMLGSKMVGTKAEFVPFEEPPIEEETKEPIKYFSSAPSKEVIEYCVKIALETDKKWAKIIKKNKGE